MSYNVGSNNAAFVHGLRKHPMYNSWHCMIARCYNPNDTGFKNYGVTFTSQNLQKIIQDINEFNLNNNVPLVSTNIDNYKLTSVGVLHEVFLNNNPQNSIKMGISLKNIGAFSKG